METWTLRPIGVVRSEHREAKRTPIQPSFARDCRGSVVLLPEFAPGLIDVEGFSHVFLLYVLHQAEPPRLSVVPFLDDDPHGIFATRHPARPNALGLSVVAVVGRAGDTLHVSDVDVLDGTPLLDIKPYVPRFDAPQGVRCGWYDRVAPAEAARRGRREFGS